MRQSLRRPTHLGFTLLEILIAMVILGFVSIFSAQAIQKALSSRTKIQKDIDKNSSVRDALKIMARDVESAFHYFDISIEVYNSTWRERIRAAEEAEKTGTGKDTKTDGTPPATPAPATPATPGVASSDKRSDRLKSQFTPKQQKIFTHFIGEANFMHFVTLSHTRTMADVQESDQAEVGYFLKDCVSRLNKKWRSQCLWRRESAVLDDDVTKGGSESVLVENVEKFELRYLVPDNNSDEPEWLPLWKSDPVQSNDERTRQRFPFAVEITLGVRNKNIEKDKPLTMTTVAPIRFPNNQKTTPNPDGTPATTPAGTPGGKTDDDDFWNN